ncbi:pyrroloquinoline quinone biosynthesis peptide chaperone PqqD [Paraburkholderia rhizosphaerae]|uniref:PqqA binding protein n=1 Tax=Paraburkholderia rhizosphaerae TaxID=480658 RepID=A0A4R8LWW2_9BURK|nr:pyrroloquinoline quinone biosynthesis peptide chaperone PqqD [Paraburkholderia rhizosphaerae]TDY52142.1 pyrroloquinoline quinone biosynthesis protein D [Paraburkholderia rhizosphaerae]
MNDTNRDVLSHTMRPKLNKLFRMQWEPAQDAHVLLYPEGMVKLNQSAAEILKRCDGTRDVAALIADLESTFNATGIAPEVEAFIAHAIERGWLEPSA